MEALDDTTVGEYRNIIDHKGMEKTATKVNIFDLLSSDKIWWDSMQFSNWDDSIDTVLSQNTSMDVYKLLV